jgi:hypothetical protein
MRAVLALLVAVVLCGCNGGGSDEELQWHDDKPNNVNPNEGGIDLESDVHRRKSEPPTMPPGMR